MSNVTVKGFFSQDNVKKKFEEMMGKKANQFITSVLQVVASNSLLEKADPVSVYQSAAIAATLELPINNNLGFAYIVPYNQRVDGQMKTVAQFQIGYKGFIQLAQRSGQFKTISSTPIYDGQLVEENPLTGYVFDFKKKTSEKVIGYAAYFQLINGFEKTLYMSAEELKAHGLRFSQSFKKGYGLWKDDFDSMATKTVLKLLISKFAPLSIDMQTAVSADQAIIKDADSKDFDYVDADAQVVDKEEERLLLMISDCENLEDLYSISVDIPQENETLKQAFETRKKLIENAAN
jgi:recombination protein RecT